MLPTSDGNDELGPSAAADRILVMASTDDAATPYTWMEPFASTLGATHRFTYRGPGHANSLSAECAKAAMESYFETGDISETSCELDPASLDLREAFVAGASESVGTGLTPSARECFADALATVDILEMYSAATSSEAKDDLAERVSEALLACLRPS